jgi:hypothetical protein
MIGCFLNIFTFGVRLLKQSYMAKVHIILTFAELQDGGFLNSAK